MLEKEIIKSAIHNIVNSIIFDWHGFPKIKVKSIKNLNVDFLKDYHGNDEYMVSAFLDLEESQREKPAKICLNIGQDFKIKELTMIRFSNLGGYAIARTDLDCESFNDFYGRKQEVEKLENSLAKKDTSRCSVKI